MAADRGSEALQRAVEFVYDGNVFNAEALFRQIVQMSPPPEMAHFMYAQFKLLQGDYADAWVHYMHRLADPYYRERLATGIRKPMLADADDAEAADTVLLVHMDEGWGDAMMCARYLPLLADRFRKVLFMAFEGSGRLFESVDARIPVTEGTFDLAEFDVHVHLFSLPALFHTTPDTIPPAKCLAAEPERARAWAERLAGPGPKVGLAWQGNPGHPRDAERSMPLAALTPVLETPGVAFYGLQVEDGADQLDDLPPGVALTALGPEIDDADARFVETAAAVANLDLVITIDSALAHLAGALGKPAWVLLPKVPDWRWMLEREDSPWYPTARLFRCRDRYDWGPPVEAAAAALRDLVSAGADGGG